MTEKISYTENESKIGRWLGGACRLNQAEPLPKHPNLNSLSDAGRFKQAEPILDSRGVYTQENLFSQFVWQMAGPMFVVFAFALSTQYWLFFLVSVLGLFASVFWQIKGFLGSSVLLFGVSLINHTESSSHLWLLGLEISYVLSLLITALHAEHYRSIVRSFFSWVQAKESLSSHLEDELYKSQELATSLQMQTQEKWLSLQKELEEKEKEFSSLSILNEVIRKTAEKESLEKKNARQLLSQIISKKWVGSEKIEGEVGVLVEDLKQSFEKEKTLLMSQAQESLHIFSLVKEELEQYKMQALVEKKLIQEEEKKNQELQAHLQQVLLERDQEKVIQQNLQKIIVEKQDQLLEEEKKNQKLQAHLEQVLLERDQEKVIQQNLQKTIFEKQDQLLEEEKKNQELQAHLEQVLLGRDQEKVIQQNLQKTIFEKQDQLLEEEKKNQELQAHLEQVLLERDQEAFQRKEDTVLLKSLRDQVERLHQIEFLYKQLKDQFEEKKRVLHEVRSELFYVDTKNQAIEIEQDLSEEFSLVPSMDMISLMDQISLLEKENQELEALVSSLLSSSRVKKKEHAQSSSS